MPHELNAHVISRAKMAGIGFTSQAINQAPDIARDDIDSISRHRLLGLADIEL